MKRLTIDNDSWLEICNLNDGLFAPLTGFLGERDYQSVVRHMRLSNGAPWTIPVTLPVAESELTAVRTSSEIELCNTEGAIVALLQIADLYRIDPAQDLPRIFGTASTDHPGVAYELQRSPWRVGGAVRVIQPIERLFPHLQFSPAQTKEYFRSMGWKTIVAFQTRNPIHRGHEYLQRVGLELTDGLMIHPLVGWKKGDDFHPVAVVEAYQAMCKMFYPNTRVMLNCLQTPMRYAGPREAVFHALIRRNFGCTHFIVGRDHAGVGGFYGKYAAHDLARQFSDLGIEILTLCGPYYCQKCEEIVTEKSCPHGMAFSLDVSGTMLRKMLSRGERPPAEYMRPEIADVLIRLGRENRLFVNSAAKE